MKHIRERLSLIIALVVCVAMCFEVTGSFSFAEEAETPVVIEENEIEGTIADGEATDGETEGETTLAALAVYQDEQLVRLFTMDELAAMMDPEEYTYSAFNAVPTAREIKRVKGVHVEDILNEAITEPIQDDQVIEFIGNDEASEDYLKTQILAERNYYPNFRNEAGRNGQKVLATSKDNKQVVPAMISLEEPESDSNQVGRLIFGQLSPSEQNYSGYVRFMVRGNREVDTQTGIGVAGKQIGKIVVHSEKASPWNALKTTNIGTGGAFLYGTVIAFDRNVNADPNTFGDRYCIYYTTDGTIPDTSSNLYNYNNFEFGSPNEKFNKPSIFREGAIKITTIVIGYGKQDSVPKTFYFTGVKKPAIPKITKITTKKKKITLKWNRVAGATGYRIYRSTKKNGKYSLVKTIKSGSTVTWTNKKLKKKKYYYYKMLAYKTISGKTFSSSYSAVKYKKVK